MVLASIVCGHSGFGGERAVTHLATVTATILATISLPSRSYLPDLPRRQERVLHNWVYRGIDRGVTGVYHCCMDFITVSHTVPVDLAPEISKMIGKMLVNHFKQSTPPKQWAPLDIPTLFGTIPEEAKTLIAHLRGYDSGLLHSKSKGLALSALADILCWSADKVNGMMSSIARAAAQMGKGPVISRNGELLRLSEDFHKAFADYNENTDQPDDAPTTEASPSSANNLKWADPSWNITTFKKER